MQTIEKGIYLTIFFSLAQMELRRLGGWSSFVTSSEPRILGLSPTVMLVLWVSLSTVFDVIGLCTRLAGARYWRLEGSVTERCGPCGDVPIATGTKSLRSVMCPLNTLRPPVGPERTGPRG